MRWEITIFIVLLSSTVGEKCYGMCPHDKTFGMKSADCFGRDFEKIPQCLASNVEIVDLSYNRIREIGEGDLKSYTDLRILYLTQNSIFRIHKNAFDGQNDLEVLDLSINVLRKLPPGILHLPSLKRLYLSQNQNMNIVASFEAVNTISSPLDHLDISFNELETLPDLGIMPFLLKYNISGNNLEGLSTKHFAGLCNLKYLANANMTVSFNSPCECLVLEDWFKRRNVLVSPFECDEVDEDCVLEVPAEDLAVFNKCKEIHGEIVMKSRLMKTLIPTAVILLLVTLVVVYVVLRRKKRKVRKLKNKTPPVRDGQMLL